MKTGLTKITILLMLLAISGGIHAQTSNGQPVTAPTLSELAANKISFIRYNPAYYASAVYNDSFALLKDFPWMQDDTGLVNKTIQPAYLDAGDAQTPENKDARCSASSLQGSVTGTISFKNYMSKTDALSIFINNLIENEISPDYSQKRFILDCRFNLVQADVDSVDSSGGLNQYKIRLSFASNTTLCNATALNILNFVRNNPWISSDYILRHFPDSEYTLYNLYRYVYIAEKNVLKPFFDKSFVKSNQDNKFSADTYDYFSEQNALDDIEKVVTVFIKNDLVYKNALPFVFNSLIETVDLGFEEMSYNIQKNSARVYFSLSGLPPTPELKKNSPVVPVYIQLSNDKNADDLLNPGEGAADKELFIEDTITDNRIKHFTDNTGRLQIWLEKDQTYMLGYENHDGYFEKIIETGKNGQYIKIDL